MSAQVMMAEGLARVLLQLNLSREACLAIGDRTEKIGVFGDTDT